MKDIQNRAGAMIYVDINKHEVLDIPKVLNTTERGKVYHVLSVGKHFNGGGAIITIKEANGNAIVYQLPKGTLQEWAYKAITQANLGVNSFPCDVKFGELANGHYAKI
jgi:hypothetical protein